MIRRWYHYLLYRSHPVVTVNLAVYILFFVFRILELQSAGSGDEPVLTLGGFAMVMLNDIVFYTFCLVLMTAFYLLIEHFHPRTAYIFYGVTLLLFIAVVIGVERYFAVTHIPLSSDFYGYSWHDIRETVASSGGLSGGAIAAFLLPGGAVIALLILARKIPTPKFAADLFYALCLLSVPLLFVTSPGPKDFSTDAEYFVALNKTQFFAEKSGEYFGSTLFGSAGKSPEEYPFLRDATYNDQLGPFLRHTETPPNLVFIMVEGLGSDFVDDGLYSGFTPFFDSLAHTNLFWKNFLSTTGRTFGILPSMFGSLPYGEKGFMELGPDMPDHLTLISLLKKDGYTTSYYYGGNANFDLQDVFLEREQTDHVVDQYQFPPSYEKAEANESGFSWGYADRDLFKHSLEVIDAERRQPRLDIYMTLSTHEPFIPPNKEYYHALFRTKLAGMNISEERKERYRKNEDIFSSLLYFDDALRYFFDEYEKRPEYQNTIFFITGDHRLIPVPLGVTIDRFRVPFVIASPLVKQPGKFLSVSSHADVTPTVISFLQKNYFLSFPSKVHWLGTGIDTAEGFRNIHSIPFMRTKNQLIDYLDGKYFLADGRLFEITDRLGLRDVQNDSIRGSLQGKLDTFRSLNTYVIKNNKLYPFATGKKTPLSSVNYDSIYASLKIDTLNSDLQFEKARQLAFSGNFEQARSVCMKLLSRSPNYHDVRTLFGRTYMWEKKYDAAKEQFEEVIRRSPDYPDAHFALSQLYYWLSDFPKALDHIDHALRGDPSVVDWLVLKAKIENAMEKNDEFQQTLRLILQADPHNAYALGKRNTATPVQ